LQRDLAKYLYKWLTWGRTWRTLILNATT
jgi:hypothetical protein